MGQYGNQPDFATRATNTEPAGFPFPGPVEDLKDLGSAALYIGTGGDLACKVVGGDKEFTTFKNIPNGTFFPVIVSNVFEGDGDAFVTTCADIVALY